MKGGGLAEGGGVVVVAVIVLVVRIMVLVVLVGVCVGGGGCWCPWRVVMSRSGAVITCACVYCDLFSSSFIL